MAAIRCPSCGHEGNVPSTYVGKSVRCPKCSVKIKLAVARRLLWVALVVVGIAAVGAASFFAFRHFFRDQTAAPGPALAGAGEEAPAPGPSDVDSADPADGKKSAEELLAILAERRKLQEARRQQEEERQALEEERLRKQKEERERLELLAQKERERIQAEKKNPQLSATLEEIDKHPDKFYGKILTIDRVVIKGTAIDRHKELARFTLGATSERNNYYSRVPLSGLLLSTNDKLAADLQRKIGTVEPFPRVKLFCEIRKWERRVNDDLRDGPEVFVYRLEIYDSVGRVAVAMGE